MHAEILDHSNGNVSAISIALWWDRLNSHTFKGAIIAGNAVSVKTIDAKGVVHDHRFARRSGAYNALVEIMAERRAARKGVK